MRWIYKDWNKKHKMAYN